tara:strand:+ start:4867 stop:5595 length:729 start_codon:yes stop_codon:yes gene_type:complete
MSESVISDLLTDQTLIIEPFSPTILQLKVPDEFVTFMNGAGDNVLGDEKLSKQFDFSHELVGKVSKEVNIPLYSEDQTKYVSNILRSACLEYINYMYSTHRGRISELKLAKGTVPTVDNIELGSSWIVSQYKGEYNPWHRHFGYLSGIIYLKIPDGMNEEYKKDQTDHHPTNGMVEFTFGEDHSNLRRSNLRIKPQVGMLLIFPAWLRHSVYPFYCDGERRSMSFNASLTIAHDAPSPVDYG